MARQNRRDRWVAAVVKSGLNATTRLFLATVLAKHMRSNGLVSVPRDKLARQFGITERRISGHIQKAKETGWLIVVNPGYVGHTAEYQATFPDAQRVTPPVTLSVGQKGDAFKHPLSLTDLSPSTRGKGDTCCHPKDGYVVTPGEYVVSDQTAPANVPNDDALKGHEEDIWSRREAPTTDALVAEDAASSSSKPARHLRAVSA